MTTNGELRETAGVVFGVMDARPSAEPATLSVTIPAVAGCYTLILSPLELDQLLQAVEQRAKVYDYYRGLAAKLRGMQ